MVSLFNRTHDLSVLENLYPAPSSSLVVLYGRRRVGKTELAKEFIKNKIENRDVEYYKEALD